MCRCILPGLLPTGQLHVQGLRLLRTASIPGPAVQHAARAQRLTDNMVSKGSMGLQVAVVISQPMRPPPQAPVVTEQFCAETATVTGACRNCAVDSETVTGTCKCEQGGTVENCVVQRMSMVLMVNAALPAITLEPHLYPPTCLQVHWCVLPAPCGKLLACQSSKLQNQVCVGVGRGKVYGKRERRACWPRVQA